MPVTILARSVFAMALVATPVLASCALNTSRVSAGRPVTETALASITPNVTTLTELLALVGPPDYVIDGTRQLLDEEAFFANFSRAGRFNYRTRELAVTPISTRILTAPEGEVILIYPATTFGGRVLRLGEIRTESARGLSGDLLVFLSKKNRTILRVVRSQAAETSNK